MLDLMSTYEGLYHLRKRIGRRSYGLALLPFRSCIGMLRKLPSPMRRNVDREPLGPRWGHLPVR